MDELLQQSIHFLQVLRGLAVRIFQLTLVLRQQRTARVEIIGIGFVVKGQGIELATERLGVAEFAALRASVCASIFDATVLMNSGLSLCKRDL